MPTITSVVDGLSCFLQFGSLTIAFDAQTALMEAVTCIKGADGIPGYDAAEAVARIMDRR